MKIKSKVTLFFSVLILIMILITIYHVLSSKHTMKIYEKSISELYAQMNVIGEINKDFIHIVNSYGDFFKNYDDSVSLNRTKSSIDSKFSEIERKIVNLKIELKLDTELATLKSSIGETYGSLLSGDLEKAKQVSSFSVKTSIEKISNQIKIDELSISKTLSDTVNSKSLNKNIIIEIVIVLAVVIIGLSFILNINQSINNSLEFIRNIIKDISEGKIITRKDVENKDEIYSLINDINLFTKVIEKFISDVKEMPVKENKMKTYSYKGIFYDTAIDIDKGVCSLQDEIDNNINFMKALSEGNFNVAVQSEVCIELKIKIQSIVSKVIKMSEDMCKGEYTNIKDESKGEWNKLFNSMNRSCDGLYSYIKMMKDDLTDMKKGSFTTSYSSLKGEMLELFKAYEEYKNVTNKYIEEICGLINSVNNKSNCYAITNRYRGSFEDLRSATNALVEKVTVTNNKVARTSYTTSRNISSNSSEKTTSTKRKQNIKVPATSGSIAVLGFSGASVYNRSDFGKY